MKRLSSRLLGSDRVDVGDTEVIRLVYGLGTNETLSHTALYFCKVHSDPSSSVRFQNLFGISYCVSICVTVPLIPPADSTNSYLTGISPDVVCSLPFPEMLIRPY